MNITTSEVPFIVLDVPTHSRTKTNLIASIKNMGQYSYINENQRVSHTDWHLSPSHPREYFSFVESVFTQACLSIKNHYKLDEKLAVVNYWFQVYAKGDYHKWHLHDTVFSCVYYASLPEDSVRTTFKLVDKEFSIEAKEGQMLIFPAPFVHCSKPNTSDKEKIVIAFNINPIY